MQLPVCEACPLLVLVAAPPAAQIAERQCGAGGSPCASDTPPRLPPCRAAAIAAPSPAPIHRPHSTESRAHDTTRPTARAPRQARLRRDAGRLGRAQRQACRRRRLRDCVPVGLLRRRQPARRARSRPRLLRGDVRLLQHGARCGAADAGARRRRSRARQRHERAAHRPRLRPGRRRRRPDRGQDHPARAVGGRQAVHSARGGAHEDPRCCRGRQGVGHPDPGADRLPPDPGHRRGRGPHADVRRGGCRHPVPRLARRRGGDPARASPRRPAGRPSSCCRRARRGQRRPRSRQPSSASRSAPSRRACCRPRPPA